MQRFKDLYEAINKTRRVGIDHLNQLKPMDFIRLVKLFQDMGGKINDKNAKISLKVDGFGLRFGLDKDDNFFIESSNSGPQFQAGSFKAYTKSKKGEVDAISIAYDTVYDTMKANTALQKVLKNNNTVTGIKVVCECLYTPIGKKEGNQIKFVAINYDQDKLGKHATYVLINVLDGEGNKHPDAHMIMNDLKALSTKDFLFDDALTGISEVDLNVEINDVLKFIQKYPDLEKTMLSRKHADRELKNLIKDTLKEYQDKMSAKLLKAINNTKFGSEFEGVVFELLNGKMFKAIHKDFSSRKDSKHRPK